MLINETPPQLFSVDKRLEIDHNYKQLAGNIVMIKEEDAVYAVCPMESGGRGYLIRIYGAERQWKEMISLCQSANREYE